MPNGFIQGKLSQLVWKLAPSHYNIPLTQTSCFIIELNWLLKYPYSIALQQVRRYEVTSTRFLIANLKNKCWIIIIFINYWTRWIIIGLILICRVYWVSCLHQKTLGLGYLCSILSLIIHCSQFIAYNWFMKCS